MDVVIARIEIEPAAGLRRIFVSDRPDGTGGALKNYEKPDEDSLFERHYGAIGEWAKGSPRLRLNAGADGGELTNLSIQNL